MKTTEFLRKNETLARPLLSLLACLFGALSTLMIVAPAFVGTGRLLGTQYYFMGYEAAFGLSVESGAATAAVLAPSALSIL